MNKYIFKSKILLMVILFFVIIIGGVYIWFVWNSSVNKTSSQALKTAETAAAIFPKDAINKLSIDSTDLDKKEYQHIKNNLLSVSSINRDVRFVYLYVKKADKLYFVADSENVNSKDYSPPGQEYTEADAQSFEPFITGKSVITKPYKDRWGEWVSVFVPIKDSDTDAVMAVFGMDYPASKWNQEALFNIAQAGVVVILLFILCLVILSTISGGLQTKINEQNYRTFFDIIDDIVVVADKEGKILYANNATFRKLGYSLKEIQKIKILELNPKNRRQEAEKIFSEMFARKIFSCPLPLERKNGTLLAVETRVWFGQWDGMECIFGISKDLSLEQEALQKFNNIFENNPALMAITSLADGKFTDVNKIFLEKLEYTRDEVMNKSSGDLSIFVNVEKQKLIGEELKKTGFVHDVELEVKTKTGRILDGLFSGQIIESQGKKYFLTVMIDQTESKKTLHTLKQVSGRLSLATRAGGVGIWDYDVVNNILLWDDQMYALYGITSAEFSGAYEAWKNGLHPDDVKRGDEEIQMALSGKKEFNTEFRVLWPDKTVHYIRALALVERDANGKALRMVGTNWDITERKNHEKIVEEKAEEIEKINKFMVDRELKMVKLKEELLKVKGKKI